MLFKILLLVEVLRMRLMAYLGEIGDIDILGH
jgi:hypothetical protein